MSAVIPEKLVYDVLKSALPQLYADPTAVDVVLAAYSKTVRDYVKTYFTQHKVEVQYGYPRSDIPLPCVTVILGGDQESAREDLVGDFVGPQFTRETSGETFMDYENEIIGYAANVSVNVLIVSESDEVTQFLYQLVRQILFVSKMNSFEANGWINVILSGAEFRFEPDYFPTFAYSRAATVSGLTYFTVESLVRDVVVKGIMVADPHETDVPGQVHADQTGKFGG